MLGVSNPPFKYRRSCAVFCCLRFFAGSKMRSTFRYLRNLRGSSAGRFGFGFFRGACCGLIPAGALLPSLRRERAAGALRLRKPSRARFARFPLRRENLRKIFAKKRFGARRPADSFVRYLKPRRKALRRIAGLSRTGRAGIRATRNRLLIGAKDC